MQHHVGPQVAPRLVPEIDLRMVMHPLNQIRPVENRLQNHLPPVALHLRVAPQGVGQVSRLGRDAAVELHQVPQLVFQGSPLLVLGRVDAFDPLAELGDIIPERLEQDIEGLLVGLLEPARLFVHDFVREAAELQAHRLLLLLASGALGLPLLGVSLPQGRDLGFRRSPHGGQLRFDARTGIGQYAHLLLAALTQFAFRPRGLQRRLQTRFRGRQRCGGLPFAGGSPGACRRKPPRLPAPQRQDDQQNNRQGGGQKSKNKGCIHRCARVVFHAKIAINSRKTIRRVAAERKWLPDGRN